MPTKLLVKITAPPPRSSIAGICSRTAKNAAVRLVAASKAALVGLVRGLTADYGSSGIRANALLPGGVDTRMAGNSEQRSWAAGLHAMKRIAEPMEIAQAALFLASDRSSFVSGSSLWVDGGNAAIKT